MMGTKIAIPEISLNTQDFSPVSFPTQGITYPERCFRQSILTDWLKYLSLSEICRIILDAVGCSDSKLISTWNLKFKHLLCRA